MNGIRLHTSTLCGRRVLDVVNKRLYNIGLKEKNRMNLLAKYKFQTVISEVWKMQNG